MAHAGIPALVTVLEGKAVLKVLYHAVRNPEESRSANAWICSSGWKQALQAFTIYFGGPVTTP